MTDDSSASRTLFDASDPQCRAGDCCPHGTTCQTLDVALDRLPRRPHHVIDFTRASTRRRINALAAVLVSKGGALCCARADVPEMKRALSEDDLPAVLDAALDAAQTVAACPSHCAGHCASLPEILTLIAGLRATLELRGRTPAERKNGAA